MRASDDRIGDYLRALRARLRTGPQEADRIAAEAEDHLREAVAAALAAGLTQAQAEDAAISGFGSVRAVVRAHAASHGRAARLISLVMVIWKVAWTLLLALGGTGAVALIFDLTAGRPFVSAPAPGTRFAASQCRFWMRLSPGAHTCAQARMLEGSSDIVTTGALCAVAGAVLLAGYYLVLVLRRRRGREVRNVLPRAFFPAVAVTVFAALGLCCAAAAAITAARGGGPGSWLSGTIVSAVITAACALRLRGISLPRPPAPARVGWPKPADLARWARRVPHGLLTGPHGLLTGPHGLVTGPPGRVLRWRRRYELAALRRRRHTQQGHRRRPHRPLAQRRGRYAPLAQRRGRYALLAHRRCVPHPARFAVVISSPGGRPLQRRVRLFWRVRLPVWAVLAAAGWLTLGSWGIGPGMAGVMLGLFVAIAAEAAISYRPPRAFRPGREPGDLAGVREPRRPCPTGGAAAAQLPVDMPSPWTG
jgi:hypothetical protein